MGNALNRFFRLKADDFCVKFTQMPSAFLRFRGGKNYVNFTRARISARSGAAALCSRIGLPRIIGVLLTGILIGPYVLNWLDDSILSISSELRQMALIIILIKAGLSLDLSDLKKVGRPGCHDGLRARKL